MLNQEFEVKITELTNPVNGQYPRPWMTKLNDPMRAKVFVVGKNQKNGYSVERFDRREKYIDALFNRNGEGCRKLYDEITGGTPSQTRKNLDRLLAALETAGTTEILETNVICYSTPMSSDLASNVHKGGRGRGEEIFRYLLSAIQPRVMIVHGASASKQLASVLGRDLGTVPIRVDDIRCTRIDDLLVVVMPSLAPPEYNKWSAWSQDHFAMVANEVALHFA